MRACPWLAVLAAAVLLAGCSKSKPQAAEETPEDPPAPSQKKAEAKAPAPEPVSAAEAEAFARRLESAAGSADELRKCLDWDALLARAFGEGKTPDAAKPTPQNPDLPAQIAATVGSAGSYRLVRIHDRDGARQARFRLVDVNGNVNYHDLVLARRDGTVKAVDALFASTGELLSVTLRTGFLAELPAAVLSDRERELLRHRDTLAALRAARARGNAAHALRLYVTLPAGVQRERSVQIQRLLAATGGAADVFRQAIEDCEKQFAGEPCLQLLSCNAYLMRKQYKNARQAVDRLDKALGGDAYLDVLRANVYAEDGEVEAACEAAGRVMKAFPDLAAAHLLRLSLSLRDKDHVATAEELTLLRQRFGLDVGDLSGNPEYANFVSSSEGKTWAELRKRQ